jgi:glutamate/tyrosine decarboxylase-like PLP-dependent enzyme
VGSSSRRLRSRLAGIDQADSITFCPQKLLLVALSSSLSLFRDWERMERSFRISFPYLQEPEAFVNRSEVGVQGSRPGEILKLWLSLQHIGAEAYGALIERFVGHADLVAARAGAHRRLEVAGAPESGIVCFRALPGDGEDADRLNEALHAHLLGAGIYFSLVRHQGKRWLRAVFVNPYSTAAVIDEAFDRIDAFLSRR